MAIIGIVAGLIGAAVGIVAGLIGGLVGIVFGLLGGALGLLPFAFPVALITIGIICLVKNADARSQAGKTARAIAPAPPQTPYSRR